MSSARVYVGNLDPTVQKEELTDTFATFGRLADVWVARNPPGFAFVTFEDSRDAENAVRGLVGRMLGQQEIRAEIARSKGAGKGGGG
jgi:arginine/serine-rich splicing factor 7